MYDLEEVRKLSDAMDKFKNIVGAMYPVGLTNRELDIINFFEKDTEQADDPPIVETAAPEAAKKVKATSGGKSTTRKGHVDVDVVCAQIIETKMPLCRIEKANGMGKGSLSRSTNPLIIAACRIRKAKVGNKGTKKDGIADRECYDDDPED